MEFVGSINMSTVNILDQNLASLKITSDLKLTEVSESTDGKLVKKKKKVKKVKKGEKTTKIKKKKTDQVNDTIPVSLRANLEELDNRNQLSTVRFRRYALEDFRLVTLLGTGGFGMVYLSKLVNHNAYYAIKFMEKQRIVENNDFESVLMEKKVMLYGNNNPFICRLFCSFQIASHLCFAMEFCCGGDLRFHLDKEKRFAIPKVKFYLTEMICAIRFLHKLGFIYRDLKLDNVMIFANGHIKLVDFGMCLGKIYRQEMQPSDFCGTLEYMAPEVIKAQRYNQSVDYWSLGIVAYEMSVGANPFTGTDEDELCWFICNLNVSYPSFLHPELKALISQLLIKNPEERLGMPNSPYGKLIEHAFFVDIDWHSAEHAKLNPPCVPIMKSPRDTSYFEEVFTASTTTKLCIDLSNENSISTLLHSSQFAEFQYTNPNMTD